MHSVKCAIQICFANAPMVRVANFVCQVYGKLQGYIRYRPTAYCQYKRHPSRPGMIVLPVSARS